MSGWGNSSGFGSGFAGGSGASSFGNTNQASQTSAAFGAANLANQPSGLLGNTSSMFGQKQAPALGGLFGNSAGNTGANSATNMGSGGGLFGNSAANGNTGNSGTTGMFGATNTGGTGLFGGSSNTATGGLFGGTNAANSGNTAATTTGLFSNNNATNSNAANTGGLFGASKPAAAPGLATGSGLFGAKPAAANTASGGLFGNSSTAAPGGLFGNSSTAAATGGAGASTNQTGGLFGNTATTQSGGLFGNTSTSASGGLFGNSATGQSGAAPAASSGLFGSSAAPAAGGLFGNSSNTQTGGLFGNSAQPAAATGTTSGLFGGNSAFDKSGAAGQNTLANGNVQASAASLNPYSSDSILTTISKAELVMPQSITGSLFARSEQKKLSGAAPKSTKAKSTLFSKLAQTFKIFRTTTDSGSSDLGILKGIFTQLNYVKHLSAEKAKYSVTKPNKNRLLILLLEDRGTDMKRLVIKSKPLKFHLINANKVLNARRTRVLTLSVARPNTLTDDELSDIELEGAEKQDIQIAKEVPIKVKAPEPKEESPEVAEDYDGYWCSPPLTELTRLSSAELSSVDNFIVGKYNVGQIAYSYPVDLTPLFERCAQQNVLVASELFGKVVKFQGSYVQVYDSDEYREEKPPIGVELNVPAAITLHVPPRKNISKQKHIKMLQGMVGQEFVTFDPVTDKWTFKVKHFSVWGLIDDSDDEGDEELKRVRILKKEQDAHEGEASAIYSKIYENEEYNQELKRQKIGGSTKGVPGGWDYSSSVASGGALKFKQRLVQEEINRQLNLYKQDKSVDALAANASDITIESDSEDVKSPNSLALDGPLYPDEVNNYDYLRLIVSVIPPGTDMNELVDEKAYEPDIEDEAVFDRLNSRPSLATSKDWLVQLELANDLNSALTPYLAVPRSQKKLSLRAVNDILFDFDHSTVDANEISTPIKTEKPRPAISSAEVACVPKLVQNLLLKAKVEQRSNNFPHLLLDSSLNFKEVAALIMPDADADVLELAAIFFDDIDLSSYRKYEHVDYTNAALVLRLQVLERRRNFSNWLKRTEKATSGDSNDAPNDSLETIKSHVLHGDIKTSVEVAISSHNSHLASLITLLDSNDAVVKGIAQAQLEDWELNNATDLIPQPLLTIYKVLAGQFAEVASDLSYVSALGLFVFYSNPAEDLAEVLRNVADNNSSGYLGDLVQIFTAVRFEGVEAAILAIQESSLTTKTKWILLRLLDAPDSAVTAGDDISESFGEELSACGLWKEAVFVFSSMVDAERAKKGIRHLVIDHVGEIKSDSVDEEAYATTVLGVPRSLIYEASALDLAKKKDFWGQGIALTQAEQWTEAHKCICLHLGPAAVIDNDYTLRAQVRSLIIGFPDHGAIIPNWNHGAGLYASYFNAIEAFDEQDTVGVDELDWLLDNLAQVDDYGSFTVKVAVKIMSKRVGDIALEFKSAIPELKRKIMGLRLGENETTYFEKRLVGM